MEATIDHISYSQYNTYVTCPRSWYLNKVKHAEQKQTWYLPIGTVVHSYAEAKIKGESYDLPEHFNELVRKQRTIEPNMDLWLAGGSKDNPIVKGLALQRAKDCTIKVDEFLKDFTVWEVEYNASGRLPGLDVPIIAYVDLIGTHKKHGDIIPDWKSGANKPKNNFQLETYKALLMQTKYGSEPGSLSKGLWVMVAPDASKARPVDLSQVNPTEIGKKYQAVYKDMEAKLYKSEAGFGCKFCFQQDNCAVNAGPTARAKFYDRSHEDGFPF